MSMSSVNPATILQAQNAYNTTNIQKTKLADPQVNAPLDIKSAESFQTMVNKSFNSFAKMKPAEIMATFSKQVQNAGSANAGSNSGIVSKMFSTIPEALRKDEDVKRRAIIGEASLTEVIAATSEAKAVLQTAVAVRNKVLDAFQRITDMPI
jgi:flagellar hook-basal body complex protein FliE